METPFHKNLASVGWVFLLLATFEILIVLSSMPITLVASLIDTDTLEPLPPSDERETYFTKTASQPFISPLTTDYSDVFKLECPRCHHQNSLVRWLTSTNTGFAQPDFSHKCERCGVDFDKGAIGVRRFADEVTRRRANQRVYFS